jgi:hypothetical protein
MCNLNCSAQDDEQDTEHGKEGCHGSGTRAVSHPQHLVKYNLSLELFVSWPMGCWNPRARALPMKVRRAKQSNG